MKIEPKQQAKEPRGFGGWLILPLIQMIIFSIVTGLDLINTMSFGVPPGLFYVVGLIDIIPLALYLLTFVLAMMEKKIAKIFFIASYLSNLLISVYLMLNLGFEYAYIGSIGVSVMWIGYFIASKRVKNTFVN